MATKSFAPDAYRPHAGGRGSRTVPISRSVVLFGYLLIASAFMSFVPGVNVGTFLFAAMLAVYLLDWILTARLTSLDGRSTAALVFLILCGWSYFILKANGYGFPEWGRAIVPFLFFVLLFTVPRFSEAERRWITRVLLFASLCWAARIVIEALYLAFFENSDVLHVRLTFRVIDAVLPFPLVAVPYLLFVETQLRASVRYVLLGLLMGLYLWIGYRAGLALLAIPFLLFAWKKVRRRSLLPLLIVLFGAAFAYFMIENNVFGLADRFATIDMEGTSSRTLEWRYAYDQFIQSPVFGQGLGWQVPGYITFAGVDDPDAETVEHVGYVHSSLAYMMMNLGITGITSYFVTIFPKRYRQTDDQIFQFSSIALLLLLLFCLTQASFRTIQTILLTIALLRLNRRPSEDARGPHR